MPVSVPAQIRPAVTGSRASAFTGMSGMPVADALQLAPPLIDFRTLSPGAPEKPARAW